MSCSKHEVFVKVVKENLRAVDRMLITILWSFICLSHRVYQASKQSSALQQ